MNRLSISERAAIIRGLVEGASIRAISRLSGSSKGTVLRLLADAGDFCGTYQYHALRRLPCKRVEADEVWGFCGAKQKNAKKSGQGDLWTYTAVCADSKLLISWLIGPRSKYATRAFIRDLAGRMAGKIQLSTDGLHWYVPAVRTAFGRDRCDYGQIVKTFGTDPADQSPGRRYSPAVCTGVQKFRIMGNPDMDLVSTSYVERNNLSIAIHAMHFNYCRPHGTLTKKANGSKTTPAMAAGLATRPWTVEEVLARMEAIFVTV